MLFPSEVLCIGSATLDRFLTVKQPLKRIKLGDKILVESLEKHSGGGAGNAAVALTKFGVRTEILAKLGSDLDAEFLKSELQQHKVKNLCRHQSKKSTDSATIIDYVPDRDRVIYVHKGASEDLNEEDWRTFDLNVKWIYLATLVGNSWKTSKKIVNYAHQKGIRILFNPSLYLAQKGKSYLRTVLGSCSILVLNWEEALAVLGKNKAKPPELLRELQRLGPKIVIITNGSKMLYALDRGEVYSLLPNKVKVVHKAGAGDAFTAAFLGAYIKGHPFGECLQMGQANASSVIQAKGVKHRLLSEKEALEAVRRSKITFKKHGHVL
jgi:sugar/nucleoside kinase (ribokinase family)